MTRQWAALLVPKTAIAIAVLACVAGLFPASGLAPRYAFAQDPNDPAPGDSLPYVQAVEIGPAGNGSGPPLPRPLCPTDSIRIFVSGVLPDGCHSLRNVEIIPRRGFPTPIVRLVVDDGSCDLRQCTPEPIGFTTPVTLSPLPVGSYALPIDVWTTDCNGTTPPDSLPTAFFPFAVGDSCSSDTLGCLLPIWGPGLNPMCSAMVAPNRPAELDLGLRTPVALAGLQGKLFFLSPGLVIRNLEAIGPAAGMQLAWTPTEYGASFVMFAETGAPIPATGNSDPSVNVLHVTVEQPPGSVPQEVTYLDARELLGADAGGEGVLQCYIITLQIPGARICAMKMCDWNSDGTSDVRDLVGMVNCLNDGERCAPLLVRTDCNGDGGFSLDDIICCARRMLGGEVPDSTGIRPEPGVAVRFMEGAPGEPLALRLRIDGANRLGAALLGLAFPTDRYSLTSVEEAEGGERWMCFSEETSTGARLGAVALSSSSPGDPDRPFELVLHFARVEGIVAGPDGGRVRVADGQFAGPDGALLEVTLGAPIATLDPAPRIVFAPPEPNPFTNNVRFVVTLPAADEVSLAVFDVAGRLVANLHSGTLPAGTHPFVWNGRRTDGTEAGSGIYFARANGRAGPVSHRIVLLHNQ
ncbi:MAG: FlgD immunoglobulin-like domain containing protein [Candidatus Eiseniibacteriota bacterium]